MQRRRCKAAREPARERKMEWKEQQREEKQRTDFEKAAKEAEEAAVRAAEEREIRDAELFERASTPANNLEELEAKLDAAFERGQLAEREEEAIGKAVELAKAVPAAPVVDLNTPVSPEEVERFMTPEMREEFRLMAEAPCSSVYEGSRLLLDFVAFLKF